MNEAEWICSFLPDQWRFWCSEWSSDTPPPPPGHIISETVWILDLGVKFKVLSFGPCLPNVTVLTIVRKSVKQLIKGTAPLGTESIREVTSHPEAWLARIENWHWTGGLRKGYLHWLSWVPAASVCLPSFLLSHCQHPHVTCKNSRRQSELEGNIEITQVYLLVQQTFVTLLLCARVSRSKK